MMDVFHQTDESRTQLVADLKRSLDQLKPPPKLSVAEWADTERRLDSQSSSEPGRWITSRAEYQRGIMDACSDPTVKEVVVMCGAQLGKSEMLLNTIGYHMAHDPAPILMMQPTVDMAQSFSKDRVTAGLLKSTPCLREKVRDNRGKDSGNTALHKIFPGGALSLVGANSPSSLASRPIRVVLCDEVDRYPASAGTEGDPISLAKRRAATFWNRKIILVSTPTNRGASRIEDAYHESDQRKFMVPCKDCGEHQEMKWANVSWERDLPKTAVYGCEYCGSVWSDADRARAVAKGHWKASETFNGVAGFHLSALYSPWSVLADAVEEFLGARKDPMRLRTFVNTFLGETWEDQGEGVDDIAVAKRREEYEEIPEDVVLLTAGVDVQDDRLECEIVGWSKGEESWSIAYHVLYGDPSNPKLWSQLDEIILATYEHPTGESMVIRCTTVDSGGHHTRAVYNYAKTRAGHRVFAIKGVGGEGKAIVGRPSKNNIGKVPLYPVGVDTAKELHYARLKIEEPSPGYCHFPVGRDDEYFKQLTAEKQMLKYSKGFPSRVWVKTRTRNEALDVRVYAIAALAIINVNMDSVYNKFYANVAGKMVQKTVDEPIHPLADPKSAAKKRNSGGFANSWR
jgi:phage terminase large subunit GpA-like protein